MKTTSKIVRALTGVILLIATAVSSATAQTTTSETVSEIETLAVEFDQLTAQIDRAVSPDDLNELRATAISVRTRAEAAAAALEPSLNSIDARLIELGEPSNGEASDLSDLRSQYAAERAELDSGIRRSRLLAVSAGEAVEDLNRRLAQTFNANTLQRVVSPLTPTFWSDVAQSYAVDIARLKTFVSNGLSHISSSAYFDNLSIAAIGVAAFVVLVWPVRRGLRRLGLKYAISHGPTNRARRSGLATWFVATGTLSFVLGLAAFTQALMSSELLSDGFSSLLLAVSPSLILAAFVISLGDALLQVQRPSWRLLEISDDHASSYRSFPYIAAVLFVSEATLLETNVIVGVSPAATAAANVFIAACYVALVAKLIMVGGKLQRQTAVADESPNHSFLPLVLLISRFVVFVAALSILFGFVNLSLFIGRGFIWTLVVASAAYLTMVMVDDIATTIVTPGSRMATAILRSTGLRQSTISQTSVILSAVLRVLIGVLALALLLAPFGPSTEPLFSQIFARDVLSIGGFTIELGSLVRAVLVLVLALAAVRMVRRWLDDTYLPTTNLDSGARNSASTIASYAGFILVAMWTLNSMGVGVERIALVVSALSVGIGFGLQAITQNFISGLILLTERPVKIGDTVRIGTDEGDIRKISVRSTEIQAADRSILVVPNSELITKTIRNMTPTATVGRISIAFSAPLSADAEHIRKVVLDAYAANESVLDEPKASISIDSLADGRINFSSTGFVSSPKLVYSVKSALLFDLLNRFRSENVKLVE